MLSQNVVTEMIEMIQRLKSSRYPGSLSVGETVSYRIYDLVFRNSLSYEIQPTPIFLLTYFRNTFSNILSSKIVILWTKLNLWGFYMILRSSYFVLFSPKRSRLQPLYMIFKYFGHGGSWLHYNLFSNSCHFLNT